VTELERRCRTFGFWSVLKMCLCVWTKTFTTSFLQISFICVEWRWIKWWIPNVRVWMCAMWQTVCEMGVVDVMVLRKGGGWYYIRSWGDSRKTADLAQPTVEPDNASEVTMAGNQISQVGFSAVCFVSCSECNSRTEASRVWLLLCHLLTPQKKVRCHWQWQRSWSTCPYRHM
jgi:hypothetical protein